VIVELRQAKEEAPAAYAAEHGLDLDEVHIIYSNHWDARGG
jgi:hypothetical protein